MSASNSVNFDDVLASLPSEHVWEYAIGAKKMLADASQSTARALQAPLDFPPLGAAIVPGDQIALAVDPNVPQLGDVIEGVVDSLSQTEAAAIEVVLWEEATDETIEELRRRFPHQQVTRHQCDDRASLRYMAADPAGNALYLNRVLVDADFALPVIAHRPMDIVCRHDVTGVYPLMSDSATQYRHHLQVSQPNEPEGERNEDQVPWLLGVNLMVAVKANWSGQVGEIIAGTPEAIGKQVSPVRRRSDDFPPPASMLIASLDGGQQQQTWRNAARAAVAASRYVQPGGTIAIWSKICQQPGGKLQMLDELDLGAMLDSDPQKISVDASGAFPIWYADDMDAYALARVTSEFRVLVHSGLDEHVIESMGLGCISSARELGNLCASSESCGVLRSAQFAGSTIDAPHRMGIET